MGFIWVEKSEEENGFPFRFPLFSCPIGQCCCRIIVWNAGQFTHMYTFSFRVKNALSLSLFEIFRSLLDLWKVERRDNIYVICLKIVMALRDYFQIAPLIPLCRAQKKLPIRNPPPIFLYELIRANFSHSILNDAQFFSVTFLSFADTCAAWISFIVFWIARKKSDDKQFVAKSVLCTLLSGMFAGCVQICIFFVNSLFAVVVVVVVFRLHSMFLLRV